MKENHLFQNPSHTTNEKPVAQKLCMVICQWYPCPASLYIYIAMAVLELAGQRPHRG